MQPADAIVSWYGELKGEFDEDREAQLRRMGRPFACMTGEPSRIATPAASCRRGVAARMLSACWCRARFP